MAQAHPYSIGTRKGHSAVCLFRRGSRRTPPPGTEPAPKISSGAQSGNGTTTSPLLPSPCRPRAIDIPRRGAGALNTPPWMFARPRGGRHTSLCAFEPPETHHDAISPICRPRRSDIAIIAISGNFGFLGSRGHNHPQHAKEKPCSSKDKQAQPGGKAKESSARCFGLPLQTIQEAARSPARSCWRPPQTRWRRLSSC